MEINNHDFLPIKAGRGQWYFFHINSIFTKDIQDRNFLNKDFKVLVNHLICQICFEHAIKVLDKMPPEQYIANQNTQVEYFISFHRFANQNAGLTSPNNETIKAFYYNTDENNQIKKMHEELNIKYTGRGMFNIIHILAFNSNVNKDRLKVLEYIENICMFYDNHYCTDFLKTFNEFKEQVPVEGYIKDKFYFLRWTVLYHAFCNEKAGSSSIDINEAVKYYTNDISRCIEGCGH